MLVLYNLHRYSNVLSRKSYLAISFVSVFLLFFIVWIFGKEQNEAYENGRIALFPFHYVDAENTTLLASSLALPDLTRRIFNSVLPQNSFIMPIEWLKNTFPNDNTIDFSHYRRVAQEYQITTLLIGDMRSVEDSIHCTLKFLDVKANKNQKNIQIVFTQDSIYAIASQLSALLQSRFQVRPLQKGEIYLPGFDYYRVKAYMWRGDTTSARSFCDKLAEDSTDRLALRAENILEDKALKSFTTEQRREKLAPLTQSLKLFLDKDSSNADFTLLAARCMIWQEKFDAAERYLKRAYQIAPWRSEIYELLCTLHYSRYQDLGFANEIELLQKALFFNPGNIALVRQLAASYMLIDKAKKAQKLLESYLERQPSNFLLLKALGQVYIQRGQRLKIFETYEKILEIEPENTEALYNLGIYYFHNKEMGAAKGFFTKALKNNEQVNSYLYLAFIAEKESDIDLAISCLQKRLEFTNGENDVYAGEARRRLFDLMLASDRIDSSGRIKGAATGD